MNVIEPFLLAKPDPAQPGHLFVFRDTSLFILRCECIEAGMYKKDPVEGLTFLYTLHGVYCSVTSARIDRLTRFCVTVGELHDQGHATVSYT